MFAYHASSDARVWQYSCIPGTRDITERRIRSVISRRVIGHGFFRKVKALFYSGWTLASANAINRAGWIVGNGVKDGYPAMFVLIPNTPGKP